MKLIPLFKCRNLPEAIAFYTGILDFYLKYPEATPEDGVIDLINGEDELQLTVFEGDALFGSVVNVRVDEVDGLFRKYVERGLDATGRRIHPFIRGLLTRVGEGGNFT